MTRAQAAFPDAEPRRPVARRSRSADSYSVPAFRMDAQRPHLCLVRPGGARIVGTSDPATQDMARGDRKFHPVHAGKVGGLVWRLLLTASGLALVLWALATWSFWTRQATDISSKRAGRWSSEISARTADSG